MLKLTIAHLVSFNTASGKYYCNRKSSGEKSFGEGRFNTASGKYYCNVTPVGHLKADGSKGFNTASGKYYCNFIYIWPIDQSSPRFNTASGKYYCNGIQMPGSKSSEY